MTAKLDPRTESLQGQQFGRLRVVSFAGYKSYAARWNCFCECGTTRQIIGSSLKNGTTKSCGCLQRDIVRISSRKHQLVGTPEYRCLAGIRSRCLNPGVKGFHKYGGRGITVCDRWMASPQAFVDDMGLRPSPDHSIERIDNDGNYSPDNCRWATVTEQARNRRSTNMITYRGVTKPLPVWADIFGLKLQTVRARLKYGWSAAKALESPVRFWGHR